MKKQLKNQTTQKINPQITSQKIILTIMLLLLTAFMFGCSSNESSNPTNTNLPNTNSPATQQVVIGFIAPLTGDAAAYGQSILKAAQLAQKEMNLQNVRMISEDTRCEAQGAVTAVNKLLSVDNAQVILGDVCSGPSLAVAPIAQQHGVAMVSASATSPALTKEPNFFRTIPSDSLQGAFAASLVKEKGYNTLAIIYSNEDYGKAFHDVLKAEFEKQDGKVVDSEAYERSETDLRSYLTKVKATHPDALFVIGNSPDAMVAMLKQIKELGMTQPIFGSEAFKAQEILDGAQGAADGLMVSSVSLGSQEFHDKYVLEYNSEPGPFAAQGYDAFKAIGTAIQSGAHTAAQIQDALYNTVKFDGATGSIKFDAQGEVGGNYVVFVAKNNAFVQE